MRETTKLWRTILAAIVLVASLSADSARAQDVPPGCSPSGNGNGAVAGALLGGVAGALLGNAVSGRRKEGGTIIGGVTGAAAGAMIGGSQPCPEGYVYRAAPIRSQDPPPRRYRDDGFWDGAPSDIQERISFLRQRVEKLDGEGWLSPRETEGLNHRLSEIARHDDAIRDDNDGELPRLARDRLNDDLNGVARKLRWKEYRTRHAEE